MSSVPLAITVQTRSPVPQPKSPMPRLTLCYSNTTVHTKTRKNYLLPVPYVKEKFQCHRLVLSTTETAQMSSQRTPLHCLQTTRARRPPQSPHSWVAMEAPTAKRVPVATARFSVTTVVLAVVKQLHQSVVTILK